VLDVEIGKTILAVDQPHSFLQHRLFHGLKCQGVCADGLSELAQHCAFKAPHRLGEDNRRILPDASLSFPPTSL